MSILDLTQPLGPATAAWPGTDPPQFGMSLRTSDGAFTRTATLPEHSGTHLDAPIHFTPDGMTVDAIPATDLVCEAAVVDVRQRTNDDPDYAVTVEDLIGDEQRHGPIPVGAVVLVLTGWGAWYSDTARYLGEDKHGVPHFPGVGRAAAEWLVLRRAIRGIGIDTPGIDPGADETFEVHSSVTLPRAIWHLEGLVALEGVPARGATVFVGVLPFVGGSGAPARVLAIVPDRD